MIKLVFIPINRSGSIKDIYQSVKECISTSKIRNRLRDTIKNGNLVFFCTLDEFEKIENECWPGARFMDEELANSGLLHLIIDLTLHDYGSTLDTDT